MARTKISVQITDYPYASEDMTSKLGLITYLGAARAGASLSAADGGKVTLNSGGFSGWFGWESTAMVGSTCRVYCVTLIAYSRHFPFLVVRLVHSAGVPSIVV